MRTAALLLALLPPAPALALCEIESYGRILAAEGLAGFGPGAVVRGGDCPAEVRESFLAALARGRGAFDARGFPRARVRPGRIRIESLDSWLTRRLLKRPDLRFRGARILGGRRPRPPPRGGRERPRRALPGLLPDRRAERPAPGPRRPGATVRTVWVAGRVLARTRALVLKRGPRAGLGTAAPAGLPGGGHAHRAAGVALHRPGAPPLSTASAAPARGATSCSPGTWFPLPLVFPGRPVRAVLTRGSITLSSRPVPSSRAALGEIVRMRDGRSGRVVVGRVVGRNRVAVEL